MGSVKTTPMMTHPGQLQYQSSAEILLLELGVGLVSWEREAEEFGKGLDKVWWEEEFKKYLHDHSDEGAIGSCWSLDQEHTV